MEVSMDTISHYLTKLDIIRAIPDDSILIPGSIPVNIYIQEAENLFIWCRADKEKLTANRLDWALVEDMPARIDTLREAQARWVTSDSNDIGIEREWIEKSPEAHAFRRDILRSLRFALRGNPSALAMIKRFGEGDRNSEMIQALRDISVFGYEHIGELKAGGFDITTLDRAAVMSWKWPRCWAR